MNCSTSIYIPLASSEERMAVPMQSGQLRRWSGNTTKPSTPRFSGRGSSRPQLTQESWVPLCLSQ